MLREKDLERHLSNDTLPSDKSTGPNVDKKLVPVPENEPKEPKIKEVPENTSAPIETERKEEDDYQLQRAKDLLKGLMILEKTPAAAVKK